MSPIRLEASTRTADLVLFDSRAVPALNPPSPLELETLEEQGRLLHLPTGVAGSFLLHLYVETPVPAEILQYCDEADQLSGDFRCDSGHVGFAAPEAAYQTFAGEAQMRTDAAIRPGSYHFTAYHAEFPGKLLRAAVEAHLTKAERRLLRAPMQFMVIAAILGLGLAWLFHPLWLLAALALGYGGMRRLRARPAFLALGPRCRQARISFPSMVIRLEAQQEA